MMKFILETILLQSFLLFIQSSKAFAENILVYTVATEKTDGFERYMESAKMYGIQPNILGMGEEWQGGDMNSYGGGYKVNLLKKEADRLLDSVSDPKNTIVMFTDSYDAMLVGSLDEILEKFKSFEDTRVLFSAEQFCWPDTSLASKYPDTQKHNPYLNSGGFIGYLFEIHEILTHHEIKDKDDDQLYYTKIYLEDDFRQRLKIKLDHDSVIFQNLHGAFSDVMLYYNKTFEWPYLENIVSKTKPLVIHGNGLSKTTLNSMSSYLAKSWSAVHGCAHCLAHRITLKEEELPDVMLALFIEHPTPFLEEFFDTILALDYPKKKLHLFVRNNAEFHEPQAEQFVADHAREYASIKRIKPSDFLTEAQARNVALDRCKNTICEYLFVVDSVARLEPNTLRDLLSSGRKVIAPVLTRPGHAWSNFWGALNSAGYYARSLDYMDVINNVNRGIWNVPFMTHCYIVKKSILQNIPKDAITYEKADVDADMTFCASLRKLGIFMFVSNEKYYGHLVNPENFATSLTHPDVYQIFDNKKEWEARYLNEEFPANFVEGRNHSQPCPDVYWFPLMTKRFCKEFIEIMEAYGKWSDGSNTDDRLQGGYEAVPTRDIHMNQVGLEKHWLHILREYVKPLQEMVFLGYFNDPPVSTMNFAVRYRPDEQPSLRPHHDSSTYTINLALNTPHVDYEGGGCHFLRYNCSVRDTKQGWILMHPGRLTHLHEGLVVTKGTRYIMISFVDP